MAFVEFGTLLERLHEVDPRHVTRVAEFLAMGIVYARDFAKGVSWRRKLAPEGTEHVRDLRQKLRRMGRLRKPMVLTVQGTFAPALLIASGWWERPGKAAGPRLAWRDSLQEWLFYGFEQWGPSWEISRAVKGEATPYLFGQLGAGDEANSLPVIVPGEKAKVLREEFLADRPVFEAEVTGALCHRSCLPEPHAARLRHWDESFDYCLLVDEEDRRHTVSRRLQRPAAYSGYLWQCWGPKDWMKGAKTPRLDEVYFLWEHTDFTKPDAMAYNLDSLRRKASYLRRRHGQLVLLQKSPSLVPGVPQCPTEIFYQYILQGSG